MGEPDGGPAGDPLTSAALRAKGGDRQGAEEFVRRSQQQVWALLANLADRTVAEDLTQETFLRAFAALGRFRAQSSARTWLLTIARRVAADHHRRGARKPRIAPQDGEQSADAARDRAPTGMDDTVALRHALAQLDQDRREAFALTQVLGLPYAEAAEVCGCPIGTIRSRVARAREALVRALALDPAEQPDDEASSGPSR